MILGNPTPYVPTTPIHPCRNCGGTEIYSRLVNTRGNVHGPDLLPIGMVPSPRFRLQICGDCGLTEWFVPEEFLAAVKEKFPPVIAGESVEQA